MYTNHLSRQIATSYGNNYTEQSLLKDPMKYLLHNEAKYTLAKIGVADIIKISFKRGEKI